MYVYIVDLAEYLINYTNDKHTINTKTPAIKYLNTNNVKAKISSPPPQINDRVTLHKR